MKSKSVLIHYLASYILIVLLAVFFFGALIFISSLNRIIQANTTINQNKLNVITSDLQAQFDIMADIAYAVRIGLHYKPSYFLRNKYYETELLDNFARYAAYSPLPDEHFLYYKGEPYLYRGSGSTISPGIFLEKLTGSRQEDLWDRINQTTETALFYASGQNGYFVVFVFPLKIINSSPESGGNEAALGAFLGFVVRGETLEKRIAVLSGLAQVPLALYYRNVPLLKLRGGPEHLDFSRTLPELSLSGGLKGMLFSDSPDGLFQILADKNGIEENSLIRGYRNTLILGTGVIIIALCGTGIILAFKNYRPIKNLATSIEEDASPEEAGDELKNIEAAFKKIRQEESQNQKVILGQLNSLQRQMVDIIIGGGYNNTVQSKAWEMGIVLEGPWYGILAAGPEKILPGISGEAEFWEIIEKIQIPGAAVYCGNMGTDHSFSILLDLFNDPSRRDSAIRCFYDGCLDKGLHLNIGAGPVIKNLSRISAALMEAYRALQKSMDAGRGIVFSEEAGEESQELTNGEEWAGKIGRALRKRELGETTTVLDEITLFLVSPKQSVIYQRYVYYNVLSAMVNIARETKTAIQQEEINNVLKAASPEDFKRHALIIAEQLCTLGAAITSDAAMRPIMEYIRLHACDYEMSLEMLREQFGYSITQLSHMIKEYAGEPFRIHVTKLRMEKAKDLLKTGMTVAEISGQVGYGSVSHFIKTFRSFFGNKPSFYREHMEEWE
jgi:AraC-like DNA-binding protein